MVCVYRDDKFVLPDASFVLKVDDEIVIITDRDSLDDLRAFMQRSG